MDVSPTLMDGGWAFVLAFEDFFVNFLRTVAMYEGWSEQENNKIIMDHIYIPLSRQADSEML